MKSRTSWTKTEEAVPIKLALVGDTHGNMSWLCNNVVSYAVKNGCERIVQLGDFGFIWPEVNYERQLDKIARVLKRSGLSLTFLPGNHEDHDKLAKLESSPRTPEGHFEVREGLFYAGRVSAWTWGGSSFASVGGAVSIDREWRQKRQMRTGTPLWWADEVLGPDEIERAKALGEVDVLLSHDGPSDFPLSLKPDIDSTIHRQTMTDIGRALKPKLWWHGHYHEKVVYRFRHDRGICNVRCLACDGDTRENAIEVLSLP